MQLPLIALVGAPNAGKSTLFNRLLGRRKALVHAMPGMTRDLNEEEASWEGRPVRLMDTGGLFPPGDQALADLVRDRVMEAAGGADVIVLVVDGRAGLTPVDRELARMMRSTGRPVVMSTWVAQVIFSNGLADKSLPLARSSTYRKPLRLSCITTFCVCPSTFRSPRISSQHASQSYGSFGVAW